MSLNVAARALNTNQSVLQTIGHNIANANTVGYSRQNASLSAVEGQLSGGGFYGKGVTIAAVTRSYDVFLTRQANATQTVASADAIRFGKMQQVESLFPLGEGSLGTMLNSALNAWVDVQANPSDSTARGVVINRSDELAARIRDTSARLSEIGETAKLQSAEVVKSINQAAQQIAGINDKIARLQSSNAVPNDLLDQRDLLLADLSKKVNITTIGASDGTLTVFVGSSYPLVLGNKAAQLRLERDPSDPEHRQAVLFVQGNNAARIPDDFLVGGELKGLQDFVNTDLTGAQAQVGRMGLALAAEVNNQQKSGLQLDGAAGADLFMFGNTTTTAGTRAFQYAAGAAGTLTAEVTDATALQASDYLVTYSSASDATIQRLSDGRYFDPALYAPAANPPNDGFGASVVTVPMVPSPVFDGLTVTTGGTPSVGDRVTLRPAADAAKSLAVALTAPKDLAVASRLSVAQGLANAGSSVIEAVSTTLVQGAFPALPGVVPPFTLTYVAATGSFDVTPATVLPTSVAYVPGQPMSFTFDDGSGPPANQWTYQLTLRGEPADTDSFDLSQTSADAVRFNGGNAQSMLALRDKRVFDGNTTLSDGYIPVFSSVASKLGEVKFAAQFSQAQAASAENQRASQAGVNLDEEAVKLIQYQQAYQASAKYMSTAQSLFDTLLSTFR